MPALRPCELDAEGVVTAFAEKTDIATPGLINSGLYIIERPLLALIPVDRPASLERDVMPIAARVGGCGQSSSMATSSISGFRRLRACPAGARRSSTALLRANRIGRLDELAPDVADRDVRLLDAWRIARRHGHQWSTDGRRLAAAGTCQRHRDHAHFMGRCERAQHFPALPLVEMPTATSPARPSARS